MILVVWLIISLNTIWVGLMIAWPRWFSCILKQRFWCKSCHQDITGRQKFVASFEAGQSLEDRRV